MSIEGEDDEIKISGSKESDHSEVVITCDRKCLHQGDRICFNDDAPRETVKKIPDETTNTESTKSYESIHSGESLFKTFNFDVEDHDPDVEKCMSFWTSILGKNVKPIKCTLLKTQKSKPKAAMKEKTKFNPCDDEETTKLWENIYKDLQKRNLEKYKLVHSRKCDPCEYIDEEEVKKQDIQDIQNLNTWQSQKYSSKIDVKAQVKRTLQALKGKSSQSGKKTSSSPDLKNKSSQSSNKNSKLEVPKDKSAQSGKNSSTLQAFTEKSPQSSDKNDTKAVTTEDKTNLANPDFPVTERKSSAVLTPPPTPESASTKGQDICCACSCDISQCICTDLKDIIGAEDWRELIQNKPSNVGPCYPCDCSTDCVCGDTMVEKKVCSCGCGSEECTCSKLEICTCGCTIDECMCAKLGEKKCPCGCGLEECICEQLYTKSCKCAQKNCDCDIIEILNAYLESLDKPFKVQVSMENEDLKMVTKQSQTEKTWILETTQKQGSYCIICGHFNCLCKSE